MKKLLLLLLLCHTAYIYGQNIWTISPNPNVNTDFHSIAEAMDTSIVESGDILQVHGGQYGTAVITKAVTIIGPGYYHGENGVTSNTTTAIFSQININEGVEGVTLMSISVSGFILMNANSLHLVRVNAAYTIRFYGTTAKYVYIDKSIFTNIGIYGSSSLVISYEIKNSVYNTIGNINNATVENCIITSSSFSTLNTTYTNCIFLGNLTNVGDNSSFNHCVFVEDTPPTNFPIGTNYFGADATTLFEGPTNNSPDGQYRLGENSDATGRGVGGTDCGIFDGNDPYILSGLPPIPLIYEINMPSTSTGTLNVNLKAKSNQ